MLHISHLLQLYLEQDAGIHHRKRDGKSRRQGSSQKSCRFLGVEICPELVWEDWDLGKEFTKTLVLKNIHNKLQKLHIRPPVSKFFSAMIPEMLVLSPGTSVSIPVTFMPLQRCDYEDSIEFCGKAGKFQIFLNATIPCHALEVPDSVMLPLCAVQHSTHTSFELKNASKLHTYYQWECTGAFQLSPEQGLLKPGQECPITVVFRPQEALVYQQLAYCRFGEEADKLESRCAVLLQALAKYPCLELRSPSNKDEEQHNTSVLSFGSVAVGQSLGRYFDIFNPSPVAACFSLTRLSGGVPLFGSEFCCDITEGKVGPGESLRVTVTFSPAVVDAVSVEHLTLKCSGALSEPRLTLTGSCIGPEVSLSSTVVDFGCIEEGGSVEKTVELVNSSAAEAIYQWDIDCSGNGVFSILPASGTVLPHSRCTLKAVYRPTQPNAHRRKVACLVVHKDSVCIDLIGTCHSELQQPVILKPEHLVPDKLHWSHRQHFPNAGSAPLQDHSMNLDQELSHQSSDGPAVMFPMDELECVDPVLASLSSPPVSAVPTELLFNHKMTTSVSASSAFSQPVSITNHTKRELGLVWTLTKDSSFSISPSSSHLAPLKSTSFRVSYHPKQPNSLHGAQLECFVYCKVERLDVDKQLQYPFWCLTVRVIGHSFQSGKEHFIPRCSLKPPQVVFPALSVTPYQTVLLKNEGDLPLTFCLDYSSIPALIESVLVVPSCGLIQPGHHQILALRTTPVEDCPTQTFNLQLQLNGANFTKELTVVDVVEKPCVSLEGGTTVYFQPTAVGSQTQNSHHIRNLHRLPVSFQWSIPEREQELIFVEPHAGELHPNESSVQTWSFSPLENKTYTLKPVLYFWPLQSDGSNKSHISLTAVGTGCEGILEAEKALLDVGEILVGSCRLIEVPLLNNSPCPVSFLLSVKQTLLSDEQIHHPDAEPSALHLDLERGTISSLSTMQLRSTVRPHRRTRYLWTINYQIISVSGFALSPPQTLCEVQAKGVFPTLQVTDGWSSGSASILSKLRLWKLFSLDSFNEHLLSSPSPAELTFKTPTRHSLSSSPSTFTEAVLDFNFSSAPVHSEPTSVVLMLHNPGSIPVDWAFLFPEDQQIELEYWAMTGEFSSTELYQMKVQDNQLFSVSPRSATLLPGQKRAVHFSYSHNFTGVDRFPVVLKLSYGREILLNFQGVTVERDQPYLHFASTQHSFTSVYIEDCSPPRQVYEIHNGGAVPVHYEVDTGVLSQLQNDNFNHPVLCCLSPEGEVLPGKTAMLEFIFSPPEARMYQMDVPIHVQGGTSTLVRFEGCGLAMSSVSLKPSDGKTSFIPFHRVPFPGQALFLSEDSILLGDIPVNTTFSRIIFLTNVSHTDSLHYEWDLQQQINQQVLQIHPDRGRLCPRECALCVLTFTSSDYPTVYQLDLICQVFLEAALVRFQHDLQCWEEERDRQQEDSLLTDKNTTESQKVLLDEELLAAPLRKGPPLRKYKTLPPIRASSSCETLGSLHQNLTRADRRLLREKAKVWRRPEPPRATMLHLEVSAHSHGIQQYLALFSDQPSKHFRCRQFKTPAEPLPPSPVPEEDLIAQLLTSLLRDILDDSAFVEHLITLPSKPDIHQLSAHRPPLPSSPRPAVRPTSSPPPPSQPMVPLAGKADRKDTTGRSGHGAQTRKMERAPADICEDVLMNAIQNLMMEAVRGELVFATDHRNINPPPASIRSRKEVLQEEGAPKGVKEASHT
ncbi:cilia- and flagella-associated protein 65 [Salarias fasciatus]|uniref:cilia- and flagella-associated protein 65 n=1 Tax=Salarias fasciatus TaxID=181472 RepID=UPI001176500B|nr:cilia- and flagella-associated protein 65 [Salarias fasciatus]